MQLSDWVSTTNGEKRQSVREMKRAATEILREKRVKHMNAIKVPRQRMSKIVVPQQKKAADHLKMNAPQYGMLTASEVKVVAEEAARFDIKEAASIARCKQLGLQKDASILELSKAEDEAALVKVGRAVARGEDFFCWKQLPVLTTQLDRLYTFENNHDREMVYARLHKKCAPKLRAKLAFFHESTEPLIDVRGPKFVREERARFDAELKSIVKTELEHTLARLRHKASLTSKQIQTLQFQLRAHGVKSEHMVIPPVWCSWATISPSAKKKYNIKRAGNATMSQRLSTTSTLALPPTTLHCQKTTFEKQKKSKKSSELQVLGEKNILKLPLEAQRDALSAQLHELRNPSCSSCDGSSIVESETSGPAAEDLREY